MIERIKKWFYRFILRKSYFDFESFNFPVIRKVSPTSFIEEIIPIQPIDLPSGKVFYLDFIEDKPQIGDMKFNVCTGFGGIYGWRIYTEIGWLYEESFENKYDWYKILEKYRKL
jgi:hypothetical protein